MSTPTDTRSIGQVLYETLGNGIWMGLRKETRDVYERAAEVIFKRGHDARGKEERALTPKAKQYRDALRALTDAFGLDDRSGFSVDQRRALTQAEAVLR